MRIYNHDDALQYEERMHEYAEDDEANREQYEFPEVEKALPECIQKTLKSEDHRAFTLRRAATSYETREGEIPRLDRTPASDPAPFAAEAASRRIFPRGWGL